MLHFYENVRPVVEDSGSADDTGVGAGGGSGDGGSGNQLPSPPPPITTNKKPTTHADRPRKPNANQASTRGNTTQVQSQPAEHASLLDRLKAYGRGSNRTISQSEFDQLFLQALLSVTDNPLEPQRLDELGPFTKGFIIGVFKDGLVGNLAGLGALVKYSAKQAIIAPIIVPWTLLHINEEWAKLQKLKDILWTGLQFAQRVDAMIRNEQAYELALLLHGTEADLAVLGDRHRQFEASCYAPSSRHIKRSTISILK